MTLIKPAQSVIESNRQSQTGVARFRFPEDLGAHAMIFNFKNYTYRGGEPVTTIIDSSIALPLPANISDSYSVQLGSKELGVLGALTADAGGLIANGATATQALSKLAGVTGSALKSVESAGQADLSTIASNAANFARYLSRAGLTSLPGGAEVESGISAGGGTAVNPHASIVFDGVAMKTHQFDWTLSPKNSNESTLVKNIINEFKKAALPSYASPLGTSSSTGTSYDRALLNYPSMVDIFFVGLNQEYYFYFKTCMINNIVVDYAPQGQALFKDSGGSRPVLVHFKVDLIESQIHTREDYEGTGSSTASIAPQSTLPPVRG